MSYELNDKVYTQVLTIQHPDVGTESVERECVITEIIKPNYYQLCHTYPNRKQYYNRWKNDIYLESKEINE